MYCRNCGSEVNENAVVCVHCGALVDENKLSAQTAPKGNGNAVGLVGFILSFFPYTVIAGFICSIIGYIRAKNGNLKYKNLSLAGIIISSVFIGLAFIGLIIGLSTASYVGAYASVG